MSSLQKKSPLLALVACIILAAGFYFLAWQPKDQEQEALEQETADLQAEASSLRNEIAALEEIQANEVEIRAALAKLEEYVPEGPAQSSVVRQLHEAAEDAGVEIESMQFSDPVRVEEAPETGDEGTVLASINTGVALEGGYFQVVDFLRRLEVDVPRAVLFTQLNVSEGGDGFPTLRATWNGDLFAIVPVADAAEPDEVDDPDDVDDLDEDADPDAEDSDDAEDDEDVDDELDDDELQEAAG